MPENKQTFLGGKMNKDLDDRLIPQGQYIDALNIQVNKADSSDVGAAKNLKGNTNKTNLALGASYRSIGSFEDNRNKRIFYFVTDNSSNHKILMYDVINENITELVNGSFLNFSFDYLITGVSVLEDFLFWTDNLNQPRRISISRAISDNAYYNSDVKISVAKIAPVYSPKIIAAENDTTITSEAIKDEFVRFAYRYEFIDNELSVLSPFTSSAFKMSDNEIPDVEDVYSSGELSIMVNGVNKITMKIPVPSASPLVNDGIKSIDVVMKKAGDPAIGVLHTINVSTATVANVDANHDGTADQPSIEYVYKSTRPKHTLPESQLTRVFDKIPVKAKALAVAGNRLMYGNITEGYNAPELDYSVMYSSRTSNITNDNPILANQSVKSRRVYQVGIVLSDIFGRSTPVLLSDSSSVRVDAKDDSFDNTTWDGDSLKIIFNQEIPDAYDAVSNPTGWYSFKVVVKQPQQEFYNVYTAGSTNYGEANKKSYIQLFGDNVNKVPRDTTSSNIEGDKVVPAATRLYSKVVNSASGYIQSNTNLLDVLGIGTEDDFEITGNLWRMYESTKKPLLANITTAIGVERFSFDPDLAVFETEPFESSIDIYYETATSGLVSMVNDNIDDFSLVNFSINSGSTSVNAGDVSESTAEGTYIATLYAFSDDVAFEEIESGGINYTINSGATVGGEERYVIEFDQNSGRYRIKLNRAFIYDSADSARSINITASFAGVDITRDVTITETDAAPVITGPSTATLDNTITPGSPSGDGSSGGKVFNVFATNGSALAPDNLNDLTFSIVSATHNSNDVSSYFSITSNYDETNAELGTGTVYVNSSISGLSDTNDIVFVIRATDQNGDSSGNDLTVTVDVTTGGSGGQSISVYKADYSQFNTVEEACMVSINDPRWTATTVYIKVNENPFTSHNPAHLIYKGASLSAGAPSNWYRNLADGAGQWVLGSPGGWNQLDECTQ